MTKQKFDMVSQPAAEVPEGYVLNIEVEKLLCAKLGIDWTPAGMSIVSLVDQLALAAAPAQGQQVGQDPAGEVHLRKGGGISLLLVELAQPLPPGTKLYTTPQSAPAQDVASWIPVTERLPSNRQPVLACYTNAYGHGRTIRAQWLAKFQQESDDIENFDAEYDEETDTYYDPEGWYELIDNWGDYSSVAVTEGIITHWMPLPTAPAAHDKQSGEVKP